ncbi:MAG: prolipoprotein diacylglyceryl transferase, partial [Coriobacteriales bacterium]
MLQAIYDAMDPVAFTIGPFEVRWYGLAYLFAFIIGAILAYKIARRWKMGVSVDDMTIFLIALIIGAVFGARLGYVLFYGNGYYLSHPDEILAFHNGGMSFHGGVIGAFIGGFIASRITKVNFLAMADVIAVVAPIGLFLGRCANFING